MPVKNIQNLEEFATIIQENKAVVVDFTAPWCGPCKIITPIYEKFSNNDLYSNVVFCKVDIEAAHQVGMEFGIKTVPTFMYFKEGKKVEGATVAGANGAALTALVSQAAQDCSSES